MKPVAIIAAALVSQGAWAQAPNHLPGQAQAVADPSRGADQAAVKDVLARYKSAIEKLDSTGTEQLFTADSLIFETGGVEGSYANYLAHHLGPELKEFKSFAFSDYKVDVRFEGPVAIATESYNYRIVTRDGEIAERLGVATSVLKKVDGKWKIVLMHNSARRPRHAS